MLDFKLPGWITGGGSSWDDPPCSCASVGTTSHGHDRASLRNQLTLPTVSAWTMAECGTESSVKSMNVSLPPQCWALAFNPDHMPYDVTRETQLHNLAKAQPGYVYRRESHTYTVPREQPRDLWSIRLWRATNIFFQRSEFAWSLRIRNNLININMSSPCHHHVSQQERCI